MHKAETIITEIMKLSNDAESIFKHHSFARPSTTNIKLNLLEATDATALPMYYVSPTSYRRFNSSRKRTKVDQTDQYSSDGDDKYEHLNSQHKKKRRKNIIHMI